MLNQCYNRPKICLFSWNICFNELLHLGFLTKSVLLQLVATIRTLSHSMHVTDGLIQIFVHFPIQLYCSGSNAFYTARMLSFDSQTNFTLFDNNNQLIIHHFACSLLYSIQIVTICFAGTPSNTFLDLP